MKIKRWFVFALIFAVLLPIIPSVDFSTAFAESSNKKTITIEGLEALDTFNKEPSSLAEIDALVASDSPERTGWSVKYYTCDNSRLGQVDNNGKALSRWAEDSVVVTDDSGRDKRYSVEDYRDQIINEYGEEVYQQAVDAGESLVYDQSRGKRMVYSSGETGLPIPCTDGQTGYYYNNMSFYLTVTFEVEEELNCSDAPDEKCCEENPAAEGCEDKDIPPDLTKCLENPSECTPIKPVKPKDPIVPSIGKGAYCPSPYIPGQIEEPFVYEIDLVTERIEGKTVDKGKNTVTPVTVYRADYSDVRTEIKKGLQADLKTHQEMLVECENIIKQLESEAANLEAQLASTQAAYSSCLSTVYVDYDEDGNPSYSYPDCSGYASEISSLQSQISAKKAQIRLAKVTLAEIREVIAAIKDYIATIEKVELRYKIIPTTVDLIVNGDSIQTKPVALRENDRKLLKYTWKLEKDSMVNGFIDPNDNYPVCDGSLHPCEVTNDNNEKETPIYISTREAVNACSIEGDKSTLKGIVRTIQEGDKSSDVQNVYEYATSHLVIDPDEKKRRAGYGFHYKVYTEYVNEDVAIDRDTKGVDEASTFKPEILASYLPYSYEKWQSMKTSSTQVSQNTLNMEGYLVPDLENTLEDTTNSEGTSYLEDKEWELPQYSVEKYSGNVFAGSTTEANNHVERNGSDELLDGGRKWYLDFYQPDGTFSYDVLVEDIGVNRLTLCNTGEVEVKGTSIGDENGDSDFVFRFVDAAKPFPGGTGWNWTSLEPVITSLRSWWEDWNYPDPTTIPSNYHQDEYQIKFE